LYGVRCCELDPATGGLERGIGKEWWVSVVD
jgi:hypothetical protein